MNQIRRTDPMVEEISRIRDVVNAQQLPDFVTDFRIDLGEFNGDPVVWIIFHLAGSESVPVKELQARSEALVLLQDKMTSELRSQASDRFPFFKYDYPEAASSR